MDGGDTVAALRSAFDALAPIAPPARLATVLRRAVLGLLDEEATSCASSNGWAAGRCRFLRPQRGHGTEQIPGWAWVGLAAVYLYDVTVAFSTAALKTRGRQLRKRMTAGLTRLFA